jgi:hypothetical protein
MFTGDGGLEWYDINTFASVEGTMGYRGFFHSAGVMNEEGGAITGPDNAARFYGDTALAWGGYNAATGVYEERGWLYGTGGIDAVYLNATNASINDLYTDEIECVGNVSVDNFVYAGALQVWGEASLAGETAISRLYEIQKFKKYQSTSATAPVLTASNGMSVLWALGGTNPDSGTGSKVTLTLNGVQGAGMSVPNYPGYTGEVKVFVLRDANSKVNEVDFVINDVAAESYANLWSSLADKQLSPVSPNGSWDVYTATLVGGDMVAFWSVQRYAG